MAISKKTREEVYNKFNGLCAYTGKPLDEKWQVDHIFPKCSIVWKQTKEVREKLGCNIDNMDSIDNLFPSIRIVNHYKRSETLEVFRTYMLSFHKRLSKLPKKKE